MRCQGFGECCQILQRRFVCASTLPSEIGGHWWVLFHWVLVALLFSVEGSDSVKFNFSAKSFQFCSLASPPPFVCLVCFLSTSVSGRRVSRAAFHNWLMCSFFIWMLLPMAETSGFCQGWFRSTAVLVNKPWGNPAKSNLRCCSLCVFTKCYCLDSVLEDMFLLEGLWPGSPTLPPDGHMSALHMTFLFTYAFFCGSWGKG